MAALVWPRRLCRGRPAGHRAIQTKGSHKKKSASVLEIFHKVSDLPPPLIFGSYGTGGTHLILVTKKRKKQNLPKTLKMAIFKRTFL